MIPFRFALGTGDITIQAGRDRIANSPHYSSFRNPCVRISYDSISNSRLRPAKPAQRQDKRHSSPDCED